MMTDFARRAVLAAVALILPALLVPAPADAQNARKLTIVGGDNQSVNRAGTQVPGGTATFKPLQVQLTDTAGKPVAGADVAFVCGSKPNAMACQLSPAGGGGVRVKTDAKGIATLNQMGGNSASAYYASGKMPIVASADLAPPVTFNLTVLDALPPPKPIAGAKMTVVAGDGQKAPRLNRAGGPPAATFKPLQVKVTDAAGKPLSGVQVTWSCAKPQQMACQSEPSGASPTLTATDGNGVATLNKMGGNSVTAYYGDGAIKMTAAYGAANASFNLTVAPEAGPLAGNTRKLVVIAGDKQSVPRAGTQVPGGTAVFKPLQVQLVDAKSGQPIPGAKVGFVCGSKPNAMACQLSPAGGGGLSVTTDAKGVATLNQMGGNSASAYYASGPMPIVVSADLAPPVTFALTVLDAAAPPKPIAGAKMTMVAGNGQKAPRLNRAGGPPAATFKPLQVKVTDAGGKPLGGVQVTWSCAKPQQMACQSEPSGASPTVTMTDGNGVATLNKMGGNSVTAYYGDGAIKMTAAYGAANASFALTVGN